MSKFKLGDIAICTQENQTRLVEVIQVIDTQTKRVDLFGVTTLEHKFRYSVTDQSLTFIMWEHELTSINNLNAYTIKPV